MKNGYSCDNCKQRIVTINLEDGVTYFMIPCTTPLCRGAMKSHFYAIPQTEEPTHEWFKPSLRSAVDKEHVKNGGLELRKR